MSGYRTTEPAKLDLRVIWRKIAKDNRTAAHGVLSFLKTVAPGSANLPSGTTSDGSQQSLPDLLPEPIACGLTLTVPMRRLALPGAQSVLSMKQSIRSFQF